MTLRLLILTSFTAFITLVTCGQNTSRADGTASDSARVVSEILPPDGFVRQATDSTSFAAWLRALPLKPPGAPLRTYDGRRYPYQKGHYRLIDMDIGDKDLQQCADAAIRLRAEYLFSRDRLDSISFNFTNGDTAKFIRWAAGYRPIVDGNRCIWTRSGAPDSSYQSLRNYLDVVFSYAGSYSLKRDLTALTVEDDISPGDVFVLGGFPGHAIIVVDVATDDRGRLALLLAQSFMPAQDIHILVNQHDSRNSPWFILKKGGRFQSRYWTFEWTDLRRF